MFYGLPRVFLGFPGFSKVFLSFSRVFVGFLLFSSLSHLRHACSFFQIWIDDL